MFGSDTLNLRIIVDLLENINIQSSHLSMINTQLQYSNRLKEYELGIIDKDQLFDTKDFYETKYIDLINI